MSQSGKKWPVVGITIGDLNGVGPEIILNTLKDGNLSETITPVIYASAQTVIYHKKLLGIKHFNFQIIESADQVRHGKINLINAWEGEVKIEVGVPDPGTGKAAFDAIALAVKDLKDGHLDALVTAPINKKTIQSDRFKFPGHTDYIAQAFDTEHYLMMMVGEDLKLATLTGHLPLHEVPAAITKKKVLRGIKTLHQSLVEDFRVERPKIAVLGLNPHAGEEGLLGQEEQDAIIPAIEEAKRQNILAFGPYPADGFFGTCMYRDYDVVLSMYHDQGLTPFKLMEFDRGVNYTAGLPGIRTSPDHGTAYSIAGKGTANNTSFVEALFLALQVARNRGVYEESTEDPLVPQAQKLKDEKD